MLVGQRAGLMRLAQWMVAILLLSSCSGSVEVSASELEAARSHLRPTVTEEEIDLAVEACLKDHAVTAFVRGPQGGFAGRNVTERDREALEDCFRTASERFDWPPPQPQTAADHRVIYEMYGRMADCLEGLGFEIEMPTFETYYESQGDWYPYDELPTPSGGEWQVWNTTCPQDPWAYEVRE